MNTKKNKKSLRILEKYCPKCFTFQKLRVFGWKGGNSFHCVTTCPCKKWTFRWSDKDITVNWDYETHKLENEAMVAIKNKEKI